jgi:hypothetical protein
MTASDDFFEKVVELAEAEAYYQTVKNLKKKDPPTFYLGRNRLYKARHAVAEWGTIDDPNRGNTFIRRDIEWQLLLQRSQAKEDAFYEPKTFRAWLRKQVNDHFKAKHHPERVTLLASMHQVTADKSLEARKEIARRYQAYSALWKILQEEGVEAAIERHKSHTCRVLREGEAVHESQQWHTYPDGNKRWKSMCLPLLGSELRFK